MLTKEQIRVITFANYDSVMRYAQEKYSRSLSYNGLCVEELVNESIIGVFDFRDGFKDELTLVSFIKRGIDSMYRIEKDALTDKNFINKSEKYNHEKFNHENNIKPVEVYAPSQEFLKMFDIVFRYRYRKYDMNIKCHICGSESVYKYEACYDVKVVGRCKMCGKKIRISAKTYIGHLKLSYKLFYRIVTIVVKNPSLPSTRLAVKCEITQKTAYFRKMLILTAIESVGDNRVAVMEKILTARQQDPKPMTEMKRTPMKILSYEDVVQIRRLFYEKIYTIRELAEIYGRDGSNIRKVIKGIIFPKIPQYNG